MRPGTHGFLLDGKWVFTELLIYMTTFSICFCGRYCLFLPSIFPILKRSVTFYLDMHVAAQLQKTGDFALGVAGWLNCCWWAGNIRVRVRVMCNFHTAPCKIMYSSSCLFPILWDEMWNRCWGISFDCREAEWNSRGWEATVSKESGSLGNFLVILNGVDLNKVSDKGLHRSS